MVKNYRNIESVKGINLDVNQGDLGEVFLNVPEHIITDYSAIKFNEDIFTTKISVIYVTILGIFVLILMVINIYTYYFMLIY